MTEFMLSCFSLVPTLCVGTHPHDVPAGHSAVREFPNKCLPLCALPGTSPSRALPVGEFAQPALQLDETRVGTGTAVLIGDLQ